MPVINLYAGTITLSGATAVYDWDAINGANAGLQAGPIIGIRIYNASTTDVVYVYVDGVHWQGPGSSVTKADGCTDPADHGEPIQPGQTV